jgi:hypothetical protein
LLAALLICAAPAARACGPFFPNQVLVSSPDSKSILQMPDGRFASELDALNPAGAPPCKAVQTETENAAEISVRIDQEDLLQAMHAQGMHAAAKVPEEYKSIRKAVDAGIFSNAGVIKGSAKFAAASLPPGIPVEFEKYLRGLMAYDQGHFADARKCWTDLLALPADQRHYRTTWAAFMLGKSYLKSDEARAIEYFKLTRKSAADGFADSLGLASASFGWEAKPSFDHGSILKAIPLYLKQRWTGDQTADASLCLCARKILADPVLLNTAAADADARQVVTAFLISDNAPYFTVSAVEKQKATQWLAAVESAAAKDMPGADRLAWLAYSGGDFAGAARWVARAPEDSAVADWVRSKLLLRDGKTDEAARVLVKVVRAFPQPEFPAEMGEGDDDGPQSAPRNIVTDLGVLQLARGQYADSMRLLMMSDHWQDAAYIAERVLTADELKAFVDKYCPATMLPAARQATVWKQETQSIRLLLARRLTRAGQWKIARDYFTDELRPKLDQYIEGIRGGHDKTKSDADRAAAFMAAARIAHADGLELLGTELGPDYAIHDGQFEIGGDLDRIKQKGMLAPTPDEVARFKANAPDDARRFHYRYIAANHAWDAAELMPDDDEATAKVLNEAGCWLKDRDPKFADKFYKALVRRCPDTELGKAAAAAHWFPKAATVKE